jgi:hypothetical protein
LILTHSASICKKEKTLKLETVRVKNGDEKGSENADEERKM